jgi:hypothetical protein
MRGTVLYGPRDIRFEDRETPKIVESSPPLKCAGPCGQCESEREPKA